MRLIDELQALQDALDHALDRTPVSRIEGIEDVMNAIGFDARQWTKGTLERVYLNSLSKHLGCRVYVELDPSIAWNGDLWTGTQVKVDLLEPETNPIDRLLKTARAKVEIKKQVEEVRKVLMSEGYGDLIRQMPQAA